MNIALIVSGGKGTRIHSDIPKQFIKINNKEMICHTLDVFEHSSLIDDIIVVTLEDFFDRMTYLIGEFGYKKVKKVVIGGETRQESVRNGLNAVEYGEEDIVLIHDGDRPLIKEPLLENLIHEVKAKTAVTLGLPLVDGFPVETSGAGRKATYNGILYNIQTPQAFYFEEIKKAHNRLKNFSFDDDISLFDKLDKNVKIIAGDFNNIKITTDEDLNYLIKRKKDE